MLYVLDTANLDEIRHINEFYPLSGVTTNPTLVANENNPDFWGLIRDIRSIIGEKKMLHVQTRQTEANGIVKEAELLRERIGGDLYIKIPISEEGLKAASEIKWRGIAGVTITTIFTPAQALMAAAAGADIVAPYVNRLDNILGDGVRVVTEIVDLFRIYDIKDCRVLAASFKNAEQVHSCALAGCHAVTMSSTLFHQLLNHPMSDAALSGFEKDWKSVYGDKTLLDF